MLISFHIPLVMFSEYEAAIGGYLLTVVIIVAVLVCQVTVWSVLLRLFRMFMFCVTLK